MWKRYLPVTQWSASYSRAAFKNDLGAGITVGVLLIPQGMAYAMIAGLPPVFGLYAALIPQVIYAILGTSRQLSVGPVAMDSLLVASGLGALSLSGVDEYISMALFLALFVGGIQVFLGLMRMGFVVNFLSRPVISGFTSAAALIIGISQLKYLLGIDMDSGGGLMVLARRILQHLDGIHWPTFGVGIGGILLILALRRIPYRLPGALIAVVLATFLSYYFGWENLGIAVVGTVPEGLPSVGMPEISWDKVTALFPIALTIALVGFTEAIAVGKAIAERHPEYRVDPDQELRALGLSNMVGSLFQSYPVTGGFSRTAVNEQAGARTGVASILSAGVVALSLLFLMPLVYFLPVALLASVVMVAVAGLIDLKYPTSLYRHQRDEFFLLLATLLITLFAGILEGILLGVLLSLLLLVYRISKPHMAILGRVRGTDYYKNVGRFPANTETDEDLLILRFDSQLFFGNLEFFRQQLERHIQRKGPALKYLILNAEAINYMDSSALHMFGELVQELERRQIRLYVTGAIGPIRDILYGSGLVSEIGEEFLFVRTFEAVDHIRGKERDMMGGKIATQRSGKRETLT